MLLMSWLLVNCVHVINANWGFQLRQTLASRRSRLGYEHRLKTNVITTKEKVYITIQY